MPDDALARFNGEPADAARDELLAVCSSPGWAQRMLAGRPYRSVADALAAADAAVGGLDEAELDAALAGHPRIGDRVLAGAGHSRREQSGMDTATDRVRAEIAAGNRAYEDRFGYVYLVCATGKSADAMLELLQARLRNDPATERAVVRDELAKINRIRLAALLGEAS
jgi:2-oxo-4-hydroxy-4-carboxy-5-ureidoimidazoline decarboxylase